jgi:hypothetical protein
LRELNNILKCPETYLAYRFVKEVNSFSLYIYLSPWKGKNQLCGALGEGEKNFHR